MLDGADTSSGAIRELPEVFETDTSTPWNADVDWTWTVSEPPLVTVAVPLTAALGPPFAAGGDPAWSEAGVPSALLTPVRKPDTGGADEGGGVDGELELHRIIKSAARITAPDRSNVFKLIWRTPPASW
jgi:hypothetical protein